MDFIYRQFVLKVTQRFFESGMRANPNDPNFPRRKLFRPRMRYRMRPRGQHPLHGVFVKDELVQERIDGEPKSPPRPPVRGSDTLSNLDRRPGRPAFHHMGPPRAPGGMHFRRPPGVPQGSPYQGPVFQRRMGGLMENFHEMITLAKSEVGVLK